MNDESKDRYIGKKSSRILVVLLPNRTIQIELIYLEKKQRQIGHINSYSEPWASRWIGTPVAYLCSKEQREEWLGDLNEVVDDMYGKKYPEWMINLICIGKTTILVVSALKIKVADIFTLGNRTE